MGWKISETMPVKSGTTLGKLMGAANKGGAYSLL
jgi:hypothetical protein